MADPRNPTSLPPQRWAALVLALVLVLATTLTGEEDHDLGAQRTRLATLEAEAHDLRTAAVPFKTLVDLDFHLGHLDLVLRDDPGSLVQEEIPPQVNAQVVRFLGLSDSERQALIAIIHATNEQLMAEIVKKSPVWETLGTSHRLEIPPFIPEGTQIEQDLKRQVERLIGRERTVLLDLDEDHFFHFGRSRHVYTFTRKIHREHPCWSVEHAYTGPTRSGTESHHLGGLIAEPRMAFYRTFSFSCGIEFVRSLLPDELMRQAIADHEALSSFLAEEHRRAQAERQAQPAGEPAK